MTPDAHQACRKLLPDGKPCKNKAVLVGSRAANE
jgi:hypothetical protein